MGRYSRKNNLSVKYISGSFLMLCPKGGHFVEIWWLMLCPKGGRFVKIWWLDYYKAGKWVGTLEKTTFL